MSVDIFGRPTNSQGFASDTKLQGLKAEDKLMKIDIMNVKTNMREALQSNDDDIHDHLIRIKFLEQELENGLTKQKQDIITETEKFMENKTFDQLKVKSIAYVSEHSPTQITNYTTFQNKIDYIENGIRELEKYIIHIKNEMQRKYNILDAELRAGLHNEAVTTLKETEKTLNIVNNHLKNIKEDHTNFKKNVKKDIANFIETLNLYDNRIKDLSNTIINLDDKIVKQTIQVLYDSGMFSLYENADEVLKDYLTFNSRRRGVVE